MTPDPLNETETAPPPFRTWRNWYWFVFSGLVAMMILLEWLRRIGT